MDKATEEIILKLDLRDEFEKLGVSGICQSINARGWVQCNAYGEDQRTGSAGINVKTGAYKEFRSGEWLSFFDFAAKYGPYQDWIEARKEYAKQAGVRLRGKPPEREKFQWKPWNDKLALNYARRKGGISLPGMKRAGCKSGVWNGQMVYALPIWGPDLCTQDPIGYLAFNRVHDLIELGGDKPAVKSISPRHDKTRDASWVGSDAHNLIESEPEIIWKVEGHTDLLALMSIIPEELWGKHVVVTNPNGCSEIPRPIHCDTVTGHTVYVLHDADIPGQFGSLEKMDGGAVRWCERLSATAAEVRNIQLPYELAQKHGKDLRDWIIEGGTYANLLKIARDTEPFSTKAPEAEESGLEVELESKRAFWDDVLAELGLVVVGQDENNHFHIFSHQLRRVTVVRADSVPRMGRIELMMICGDAKIALVKTNPKDEDRDIDLQDVREAIVSVGHRNPIDSHEIVDRGIWKGRDSVIVVGGKENAKFQDGKFERVTSPLADGQVLRFGHEDWFDFDGLKSLVEQAKDPSWRQDVIGRFKLHVAKWIWENENAPNIISGLALASWVQTVLPWRPMPIVSGRSDCGKTMFMEGFIRHIYGPKMGLYATDATEAGLRQQVGISAPVLLLDEFESNKSREALLKSLRGGSRNDGGTTIRGTANQKSTRTSWRMIPWLSAISTGVYEEADVNRSIPLGLMAPGEGRRTLVDMPTPAELQELGMEFLAIAIVVCRRAVELYKRMIEFNFGIPDLQKRRIESLAIPAAMLAVAYALDDDDAGAMLGIWLNRDVMDSESSIEADHDDLLHDILTSEIVADRNERVQVISALTDVNAVDQYGSALARYGVAKERVGEDMYLAVNRIVTKKLLWNDDRWKTLKVPHHVLKHLSGSRSDRADFNGNRLRATLIPWKEVARVMGFNGAAVPVDDF